MIKEIIAALWDWFVADFWANVCIKIGDIMDSFDKKKKS